MLSPNETPGLAPPPTEAQGRFLEGGRKEGKSQRVERSAVTRCLLDERG